MLSLMPRMELHNMIETSKPMLMVAVISRIHQPGVISACCFLLLALLLVFAALGQGFRVLEASIVCASLRVIATQHQTITVSDMLDGFSGGFGGCEIAG
jgi:hypothetical protein